MRPLPRSAIPDPAAVRPEAPPSVVYEELHRPTIVATSWAFTVVRAAVGFFVFGLAFALRRESEPAWMYGATVAVYGAGAFAGNAIAPVLRRRYGEDRLTAAALIVLAIVAAFGALGPSRLVVFVVAIVLGGAGSVARQGFDSLVQTAAPTATHGRAFARFETRFQVAWVIGAVAATAIGVPIQISLAVVAVGLVPAAVLYVRSLREAQRAHVGDPFDPVELARRRLEHAAEWHERELDRLAVTELSGVDRPRPRAPACRWRPRRSAAWTSCAPSRCRPGPSTPATSSGHWLASVSSSTVSSEGPAVSRARASRSSGAAVRTQATATTK